MEQKEEMSMTIPLKLLSSTPHWLPHHQDPEPFNQSSSLVLNVFKLVFHVFSIPSFVDFLSMQFNGF